MDDQSIVGYTITAGYLLSSLLLFYSLFCRADCYDSMGSKRSTLLWSASATLALWLGINKQLDVQTYLTQWGRELSRNWGIYSARRNGQLLASVLLISLVVAAAVCDWLRSQSWVGAESCDFRVGHMFRLGGASLDLYTSCQPLVSSRYRRLEDELELGMDGCRRNRCRGVSVMCASSLVDSALKS
jgi:hypothetical protein